MNKRALQIRKLKASSEELRRAPLPCDAITDILDDLATLPMTTPGYITILREGAAVCSSFMFYSRDESSVSCRLVHDMSLDNHNITLFVNREKGGHRKRRDGFKPLLQIPAAAVPAWTALLRHFITTYRDAAFRAALSAKQYGRFLPAFASSTVQESLSVQGHRAELGDSEGNKAKHAGGVSDTLVTLLDFVALGGPQRSRWIRA
eukprot:jgi/Tetstr1/441741/TSEL_029963.t1